jgi:S1-C subfamily serine protease
MASGVGHIAGQPRRKAATMWFIAASAVAILASATGAHAQNRTPNSQPGPARVSGGGDVLGHGEAFLALGTRNSREAAIIFAREYAADFPSVSVARLSDGNWATFAGIVESRTSSNLLASFRNAGRIPNGSFLVPGERVDDIVWSASNQFDHESLQLAPSAPRSPIITGLGISGRWASRPEVCNDTRNEDLLETSMDIEQRAMRWGSFGRCSFGSIVRVGGGVFLDANCQRGDKAESFVLSLKRQGNRLTVITDPTEKNKLTYELQMCPRTGPVAMGPGPQTAPPRPTPPAFNPAPGNMMPNTPSRPPRPGIGDDPNRPPVTPASRTPGPAPRVSDKPKSTGSGFFVSNNGFIVTNHHVINECDQVQVKGFGAARLVQADADNDLALLKVEPQKPVPFLKVRTDPARLGQDVVVFGYPLASFLDNGLNVTTGIISSEIGMHNDKRMLQFTAAIQPGNSGGPVVDRTGNLVAVVRSKFSDKFALERGSFVPQSLNYGIKTEVLMRFLGENGITPQIGNEQKDQTIAELAATARDHTLLVTCH